MIPPDPRLAGGTAAITGSSGLVGRPLRAALEQAGYACRVLVRRPARAPDEIEWNPERGTLDPAALTGVDIVINLAGENIAQRWTAERQRRIRDSRVAGTTLLATTIARLERKPRVLVSMSASGIYGDRGDEELDESSSHGNDFLANVCEAWEAATSPAAAGGTRVVTPRMGVVLAREGGALAKLLPVFRLGLGGRVGNGRQWMSWVALTDVIRALLFVVENEVVSGPVNLVAPNPVTNAEFTRALGRVLGRPTIFPVPAAALELAMGRMAKETILASQRLRPRALLESRFEFSLATVEAALRTELRE